MPLIAHRLRTNGRTAPEGVDPDRLEFSWQLIGDGAGQAAYELELAPAVGPRGAKDAASSATWRSGRREFTRPFGVTYSGPALLPGSLYRWRVRLWTAGPDNADRRLSRNSAAVVGPGPWSSAEEFVTGLRAHDWTTRWVGGVDVDIVGRPLYLRGLVDLPAPVRHARAQVSALGWYRLLVNGNDLTGDALVPRWTPFDHAIEYQSYDVTDALQSGENVLGLVIGDGRFRGALGFHSKHAVYGDKLAGLVQVTAELENGEIITFGTDSTWVAGHGRITASDPKAGESVDLRIRDDAWFTPGETPAGCVPVTVLNDESVRRRTLVAEDVGSVRVIDRLAPVRVWRSPAGKQLVDFGQNFAGSIRVNLPASPGVIVTFTFSEALAPDGELDTTWILHNVKHPWAQRDSVTLGQEPACFQPWFTIHGFRYVEVAGLPEDVDFSLREDDVEGLVYSSDLGVVGTFECSDDRLNKLWSNVLWSTRSNFTDTPTDCPTRERSGWTGDLQVFTPTALRVVDCQWFLRRYLANLTLEQLPDGRVPVIIPSEQSTHNHAGNLAGRIVKTGVDQFWQQFGTSVGWGDAAVLVPWELYRQRGDLQVLADQYDTMRRWVDQCERRARKHRGLHRLLSRHRIGKQEQFILDSGFHWGEWLRPGEAFPRVLIDSYLHREVVATAYLAHSARVLAHVANLLGRTADGRRYATLADHVRDAWQAAFLHDDGTIGTDRQDDYVRALALDLVPTERQQSAVDRLVELVEDAGDHLATGFLSTPMLLPVLTDHGRADVAYRLLLQDTTPSWLGQVERGATTIWETWEGYDTNGNARESHNHYAFGAVASWLMSYLVGIQPTSSGYRTVTVDPVVGGGLTHAAGALETPYGLLEVYWHLDERRVHLDVTVPHGVDVTLPVAGTVLAGPGKHAVSYDLPDVHQESR